MSNEILKVAIVGGGAGAVEFAIRLHRASRASAPAVALTFFEPAQTLGRGIAWADDIEGLIANMRVETLGPSDDEVSMVLDYLSHANHREQGQEYPSRQAVGQAISSRWEGVVNSLPESWSVTHARDAVVDISPPKRGRGVLVRTGSNQFEADCVVLAIGNLSCRPRFGSIGSVPVVHAWDANGIGQIPRDAAVLVRGASLSAIDTTIRLENAGHQGPIAWHSRSGTLPFVRPRQLPIEPGVLTRANLEQLSHNARSAGTLLQLEDLFKLYAKEIVFQTGRRTDFAKNSGLAALVKIHQRLGDPSNGLRFLEHGIRTADQNCLWFSVAKLFDAYVVPMLWNAMSGAERLRFLSSWNRDFLRYWAPIPAINAQRILDWLQRDRVQLLRGNIKYATIDGGQRIAFDATLTDPLRRRKRQQLQRDFSGGFEVIVDASGIPGQLDALNSELVSNLLKSGVVANHTITDGSRTRYRGMSADWRTGKVNNASGQGQPWLYSLTGSLMLGVHGFTNSYLAVALSAHRTARAVVDDWFSESS